MRISGGHARGTALASPKSGGTRPTSDRVRQALFNILEHGIDEFAFEDKRVLDLFAGTGALGLEALSRGARFAVFIDESADARGTIRENVERTGMTGKSRISRRDGGDLGPVGKYEPFDLAFVDPPYGLGLGARSAASVAAGGWLNPGGLIVIEERKGADFEWPNSFLELDERSYGDTTIRIARLGAP